MLMEMMPMLANQLRAGGIGVIGIDMPACSSLLEDYGVHPVVSAVLLPHFEQGLLAAIEARRESDTSK